MSSSSSIKLFDLEYALDVQTPESAAVASRATAQLGLRVELSNPFHKIFRALKNNSIVKILEEWAGKRGVEYSFECLMGALFASNAFGDSLGWELAEDEEGRAQAHAAALALAAMTPVVPPSASGSVLAPAPLPPAAPVAPILLNLPGLDRQNGYLTRFLESNPPTTNRAIDVVQGILGFLDTYALKVYAKDFAPALNEVFSYNLEYSELRNVLIKILLQRIQSLEFHGDRESHVGELPRLKSVRASLKFGLKEAFCKEVVKAEERKSAGRHAVQLLSNPELSSSFSAPLAPFPTTLPPTAKNPDSSLVSFNGTSYPVLKGIPGQGRRALKRSLIAGTTGEVDSLPPPRRGKRGQQQASGSGQLSMLQMVQQQQQQIQALMGANPPNFHGNNSNLQQNYQQPNFQSNYQQPSGSSFGPPSFGSVQTPQFPQQQQKTGRKVHVCKRWMQGQCSDPCPNSQRHAFRDAAEAEFLQRHLNIQLPTGFAQGSIGN
jgi:hypothetical protein